MHVFVIKIDYKVYFCNTPEAAGRALESEVNAAWPGVATFIQCDVTKEEQIKVNVGIIR